jgi:hypothetical protein
MLTKKIYINLLNKLYYEDIFSLYKHKNVVCFINLSFRLEQKLLVLYQVFIYFFLTLLLGQSLHMISLKKSYKRLGFDKGYPLGNKVHIHDRSKFYAFIYYFNKWFYYNIFGDLKRFFIDKKQGKFFGVKFPFLNLFYFFDYNMITLFLFNVNIPNFKIFISTNSNKLEAIALKNIHGLV